jgi:hypothetical protein
MCVTHCFSSIAWLHKVLPSFTKFKTSKLKCIKNIFDIKLFLYFLINTTKLIYIIFPHTEKHISNITRFNKNNESHRLFLNLRTSSSFVCKACTQFKINFNH